MRSIFSLIVAFCYLSPRCYTAITSEI